MTTLIPQFNRYSLIKKKFYETVLRSPVCCKITLATYNQNAQGYDAVVGNTTRTETSVTLPCLYTRTFDDRTRSKYGLTNNVSGMVYVSPDQLVQAFGTYRLPDNQVTIELTGEKFYCAKIVYNGEISNYNDSCVSVEFRLKDIINAGE
jgi:hypothetical protein